MNRPIKFRAWVPNDIAIWLTSERKEVNGKMTSAHMRYDLSSIRFWEDGLPIQVSFLPEKTTLSGMRRDTEKPIVLMQFTGLTDKNGKEIYEGDIPEKYSWIGWCDRCCGFQPFFDFDGKETCHRCDGNYELADIRDDMVIIGNIYENAELLGV